MKKKYIIGILIPLLIIGIVIIGFILFEKTKTLKKENEMTGFQAFYEPTNPEDVEENNGLYYDKTKILLTAIDDADYSEIKSLVETENGIITGYISDTNDYQIKFSDKQTYQELEEIIEKLKNSYLIEDANMSLVAPIDIDSVNYNEDSWLDANNTEDVSGKDWDESNPEGNNWWAEAIHMPSVWNMDLDLQPVRVGIIDTMFDVENKDLDEGKFIKLWNNPKNEDGTCNVENLYESANDKIKRNIAHGTHVAGIIAAEAGNKIGITGINPNAELYGYAVFSDDALESPDYAWGDIFIYKVAFSSLLNEGVKIINLSMGNDKALIGTQNGDANWTKYTAENSKILESFFLKYINKNKEFLLVKSAGNEGTLSSKYDAKYDLFGQITDENVKKHIIIVGAAENGNPKYKKAYFSNIGEAVSVYAPGVNILSVIPSKDKAEMKDGTSMATPIVSGIASLIWGINPELSSDQVKQIIINSTKSNVFDIITNSEQNYNFEEWDKHFRENNEKVNFEDRTTIVDAKLCIDMALRTVEMDQKKELQFGTVNGMVYSLNADGSNNNEFDISTLSLYNKNGEFIKDIEVLENFEYSIDEDTNISSAFIYHTYTELLEPGDYTITAQVEGYESLSQSFSVNENEVITLNFDLKPELLDILAQIPSDFTFSSGAGGWSTQFTLEDDGSFTGQYYDSDMGDIGAEYPSGTVYISKFTGKFTTPTQINDYTYSMRLENLQTEGTTGEEYFENGQRFIYADPYGFDNADEFLIYTPDAPMSELPEGFKSWLVAWMNPNEEQILPCYGIYNVGGEEGFVGYEDTSSENESTNNSNVTQETLVGNWLQTDSNDPMMLTLGNDGSIQYYATVSNENEYTSTFSWDGKLWLNLVRIDNYSTISVPYQVSLNQEGNLIQMTLSMDKDKSNEDYTPLYGMESLLEGTYQKVTQ